MFSLKTRIAALAATAVAGGAVIALAPSALAATAPASAITNDPNASNGTLAFYNTTGDQVTSGTDLTHLFDYALASSAGRTGATKATLYFAFPDSTKPNSVTWFKSQKSSSTNYPNANAPAPLNSSANPLVTLAATDGNLAGLLPTTTLDHSSGYDGIVQVRVYDSGPGVPVQSSPFWASDIFFDQAANTWQQVYPTVASKATTISAITANPASPAPAGTTSVALSATVSGPNGAGDYPIKGSVHLFDGTNDLGAATYDPTTGKITATATVADSTSYAYKFAFTPSSATYSASSSAVLNYTVNGVAHSTTTALTGPASATVGDSVPFTATVTDTKTGAAVGAGNGAVQFSVDGTNVGSPVALTANGATYNYPAAAGSHSIGATFIPADTTKLAGSSATPVTIAVAAATTTPDPQDVTVTVPAGTLTISTPYTATNPFSLGTMKLDASGKGYTASGQFGDPAAAAAGDPGTLDNPGKDANGNPLSKQAVTANGVTITDTRAGSTGWTASAQVLHDFSNGNNTPINGDNLTFTKVTAKYLAGNAIQSGVNTNSITAFKSQKKAFANTTQGPGTVDITGELDLTAPTSTKPGTYTTTINFTIA